MKENSIEEDIKILRESIIEKKYHIYNRDLKNLLEHILSDYKRVLKENEELKKIHIQDNKRLDFIMKHSITVQKLGKLINELTQDDINMTRKYKEKNNITGELLGIDKVRVRAYREKTREIKEKLHKLLSD